MYFRKMFITECQKFRFSLLLAVFFGLALAFTSCSDSKQKHINRGEDLLKQRKFQVSVMEFRAAALTAELKELSSFNAAACPAPLAFAVKTPGAVATTGIGMTADRLP